MHAIRSPFTAKTKLSEGWSFGRFVKHLDGFVFFWPGNEQKTIDSGWRHFARYADEYPAVLRIPTKDLFEVSRSASLLFSHYNSGSPCYVNGSPSPLGPGTFTCDDDFCILLPR